MALYMLAVGKLIREPSGCEFEIDCALPPLDESVAARIEAVFTQPTQPSYYHEDILDAIADEEFIRRGGN